MIVTSQALVQQVHIYLRQEDSLASDPEEAKQLAEQILRSMKQSTPTVRRNVIHLLDAEIQQGHSSRCALLRNSLTTLSKVDNWRDSLLGSYRKDSLKIRYPFMAYSNNGRNPLTFDTRFKFVGSKDQAAFFGSTFATNKKNRINDKGSHLLDAAYGAECYKRGGDFSGLAFALADGAGGHLDDERQDQCIANAAYFAAKSCVRFISAYHRADELKSDLPDILLSLKAKVNQKGGGEGTTLLGCRAFIEETGVRLIGFNIGDCLMVAWDPQAKHLHQLLPSQTSVAGVAMFPFAYRDCEVQSIDQVLPFGSFVFLLSDGIHDHLPHTEETGVYPNQLAYRSRHLTGLENLFKAVPKKAPVESYLQAVIQEVIQNSEKLRQQNLNQDIQMGDDATLIGFRLTQPTGLLARVFTGFKKLFS